jgi:hypothetical protein
MGFPLKKERWRNQPQPREFNENRDPCCQTEKDIKPGSPPEGSVDGPKIPLGYVALQVRLSSVLVI